MSFSAMVDPLNLIEAFRIDWQVRRLGTEPTATLIEIWSQYEGWIASENRNNPRWRYYEVASMPDDHIIYRASAAAELIREREGDDVYEQLTGIRRPRTLWKKLCSNLFSRY